jgi:hypothetical protein
MPEPESVQEYGTGVCDSQVGCHQIHSAYIRSQSACSSPSAENEGPAEGGLCHDENDRFLNFDCWSGRQVAGII